MLNDEHKILIKEFQSESIERKQLVKQQLELIYNNNWFNLWVPKSLGGLEIDFPQGLQFLKDLAYEDGGFAWTVTLCAGANMFAGFIDPKKAKDIWQDREICFGGSGKIAGRAEVKEDHYLLTGMWNYATGAPHLTYFTLNAPLMKDGNPLLDANGQSIYKSFFVDKDQVLIHYDWDTFGLECTASHSFSLEKIKVPFDQAFDLIPSAKTMENPLFEIPFMCFAELTLLMNYMGMFERFLDLLERQYFEKSKDESWRTKHSRTRFKEIDGMRTNFESSYAEMMELAKLVWDQVENYQELDEKVLEIIGLKSRELAKWIRLNTAALIPYAGIKGAQRKEEINIVFRNLFTASQHGLLNV